MLVANRKITSEGGQVINKGEPVVVRRLVGSLINITSQHSGTTIKGITWSMVSNVETTLHNKQTHKLLKKLEPGVYHTIKEIREIGRKAGVKQYRIDNALSRGPESFMLLSENMKYARNPYIHLKIETNENA